MICACTSATRTVPIGKSLLGVNGNGPAFEFGSEPPADGAGASGARDASGAAAASSRCSFGATPSACTAIPEPLQAAVANTARSHEDDQTLIVSKARHEPCRSCCSGLSSKLRGLALTASPELAQSGTLDASVCRSEEATCGDASREIDDRTTP
jgi:hypothetical protein